MGFKEVSIDDTKLLLKPQGWTLYALGIAIIATRMQVNFPNLPTIVRHISLIMCIAYRPCGCRFARIHRLGWKHLGSDDYLMLPVAACYTILTATLNYIAWHGGSNLYRPENAHISFTPEMTRLMIYCSKLVIVSEQAMLNGIWLIKACLLLMYWRLLHHTTQRRWVKLLAVYVFIGWVAIEITFFSQCRPFSGYWGVPPPDDQCATWQYYAYTQAPFNLSSDVAIWLLPWPMINSLKVHWKEKLVLGLVFSLGILVIVAAILTKVFNLGNVYDTTYMLWYSREYFVAVCVSNLPMIWPLMREYIPFLRSLSPSAALTPSINYFSRRHSGHLLVGTPGLRTAGTPNPYFTPDPNRKSYPLYGVSLETWAGGPDEEENKAGGTLLRPLKTRASKDTIKSKSSNRNFDSRQGTSCSDSTTLVAPLEIRVDVRTWTRSDPREPRRVYKRESSRTRRKQQSEDSDPSFESRRERPASAEFNAESSVARNSRMLDDIDLELGVDWQQEVRPASR